MSVYIIQSKDALRLDKECNIINSFKFGDKSYPDGAGILNIPYWVKDDDSKISIVLDHATDEELYRCELLSEMIHGYDVVLSYIPYSREDKPHKDKETFRNPSLLYTLNTNLYKNADNVIYTDPHSNVFDDILCSKNILSVKYDINKIILNNIDLPDSLCLICADKGAKNRIYGLEKLINPINSVLVKKPKDVRILEFDKKRNQSTGEFISYDLCDLSKDIIKVVKREIRNYYIIDDICDGGKTFIEASKRLQKENIRTSEINLITTYGLYTKGTDVVKEHFNNVMCFRLNKEKLEKGIFSFEMVIL